VGLTGLELAEMDVRRLPEFDRPSGVHTMQGTVVVQRGSPMKFVQIVEFQTTRLDDVLALDQKWRDETKGKRTATAMTIAKDRDKPDTYLMLIEFPSYDAAQQNNELPETQNIAQEMQQLSSAPAVFRNLDVMEQRDL